MKLRNKKTGKVQTCDFMAISDDSSRDGEIARLNSHVFIFRSIKQLNEEYEDYKPVEPLIKDEKIRKAVRAWADANNIEFVSYYKSSHYWYLRSFDDYERGIDFWLWYHDGREPEMIENKSYTIDELCGEEEECLD